MQNMMVLENGYIQTAYGILGDVSSYEVYDTGELKSVMLKGKNMVVTHAGELVPYFTVNERRKNKPAIAYYKNGMIKSVYLEERQELETPIGEFPAEMVTFYETGEICRVFPLEGRLDGFRSEEDERQLQIPFSFDLGFTVFQAFLNSICFYPSGNIRSITLFPGEKITVQTNYGDIQVRNGISLYEDGTLQSCESLQPVMIKTPIGVLMAYDPEAVGLSADSNSLVFSPEGELKSLVTMYHKVAVQTNDERLLMFGPQVIPSGDPEEGPRIVGMKISFTPKGVMFGAEGPFNLEENGFTLLPFNEGMPSCSPADCASCSLCKG